MRDFTFIYDGNEKYLQDGSINLELVMLLYERVKDIQSFQLVGYSHLPRDHGVSQYLRTIAPIEDEVCPINSFFHCYVSTYIFGCRMNCICFLAR